MQLEPAVIDEIVRRVMERIHVTPAAARTESGPSKSVAGPHVTLSETVITQDVLSERVNGLKQVLISAKAILTPSARDFVRTRGIEVVRRKQGDNEANRKTSRWQVVIAGEATNAKVAVESLQAMEAAVERKLLGTTNEAAAQATSAICRGEADSVLVLAAEPELAACLVNRNERVRGAVIANGNQASRVREKMQANVWIVNPADHAPHGLKSLVKGIIGL